MYVRTPNAKEDQEIFNAKTNQGIKIFHFSIQRQHLAFLVRNLRFLKTNTMYFRM